MAKFALQLRIAIAVMIAGLDPFETVRWVSVSCNDGVVAESSVNVGALLLSQNAIALAWEAVCCALPNATNARIEMTIESITHNVTYDKVIFKNDSVYTEWSPELSKLMRKVKDQIQTDMVAMLTDIAEARYQRGDVAEEEPHYELRKRD